MVILVLHRMLKRYLSHFIHLVRYLIIRRTYRRTPVKFNKNKKETMKKSKRMLAVLITVICGALFIAGAATQQNKKTTKETTKTEKKMGTKHLTKAEFLTKVANFEANPKEWKYLGNKPCIIDFYATWCGPCKAVAPVLEELAEEYAGKIDIYKVDVDQEQELAGAFGIRSVPSILFVPMDGQPQMAMGAMSKADFKKAIEEILLPQK